MKKLIFAFCFFALPSTACEASTFLNILTPSTETSTQKEKAGPLATLSELNTKRDELTEKKALIEFEKTKVFPEQTKIESLNKEFSQISEKIKTWQSMNIPSIEESITEESPEGSLDVQTMIETETKLINDIHQSFIKFVEVHKLDYEVPLLTKENILKSGKRLEQTTFSIIEKLEKTLQEKRETQKQLVQNTETAIEELEPEIKKLQTVFKNQVYEVVKSASIFLGLILSLFIARKISEKGIEKFSSKLTDHRKNVLLSLNKWVFNILIVITILVFFSSQFISVLPFLAILGTALGFALRDVIVSFIGWFVIGIKDGYKVGDVVKIGTIYGRVKEITPLLTVIQEQGLNGITGKRLSVPNKRIFEEPVWNWSKMRNLTYIAIEFFLEQDSNIKKAEEMLRKAITEENQESFELAEKCSGYLKKYCDIDEEKRNPKVFLQMDPRGIMIRGKVFVDMRIRHRIRSNIIRNFIEKVQQTNDIKFRFINQAPVESGE